MILTIPMKNKNVTDQPTDGRNLLSRCRVADSGKGQLKYLGRPLVFSPTKKCFRQISLVNVIMFQLFHALKLSVVFLFTGT